MPDVTVHGPYEEFGIELVKLFQMLIEGQSPEQKVKLWQNWIDFWQPLIDLMTGKPTNV